MTAVEKLRASYREATVQDDGWPVNSHDACMRLGARFRDALPALLDVAEAAERVRDEHRLYANGKPSDDFWLALEEVLFAAVARLEEQAG